MSQSGHLSCRRPLRFGTIGEALCVIGREAEYRQTHRLLDVGRAENAEHAQRFLWAPRPIELVDAGRYDGGFLAFWGRYLRHDQSFGTPVPTWNHLWFVAYLLVYTLLVAALWPRSRARGERSRPTPGSLRARTRPTSRSRPRCTA